MKSIFIFLFALASSGLHAQELVKTDYEQGYVKDGKKYSVWQYVDDKKQPELVINHTTGRVTFVSKDTSDYVIFKDGKWLTSKLDVHPIPIEGSHHFYQSIFDTLKYPIKDFKNGLEGKVVITFDVDTLGTTTNYDIVKSIGGSCDSAVLAAFKAIDQKWIPAKVGKKKYVTRFLMSYEFRTKTYQPPLEYEDFQLDSKKAKLLDEFIVNQPEEHRVFTLVEKSSEFPGGMNALAKFLGRTLKYPPQARRLGIEGRVFVRFIVEADGGISTVELLKGVTEELNEEAMRVVSIMPKWKPGEIKGKPVRQSYVLPIAFELGR